MKLIAIMLLLPCADDVPERVVCWMAKSLAEHATQEFKESYAPLWSDGYEGPPLIAPASTAVCEAEPVDRHGRFVREHPELFPEFRDDEAS